MADARTLPRAADPMVPRPAVITRVARETADTFTWTLDASGWPGGGLSFLPGQFNMLYAFGAGEVPISISGDPARPEALVHTIRAVGAVTQVLARLRKGDAVGVRGPFGTAWPVDAARGKDVVFVAGGLGLAPLRPAIYHVLGHRADYGRVVVLYGARDPGGLLYRKELERVRGRLDVDLEVTVDHAPPEWRSHVGVVTGLVERATFDGRNAVAFVCGPEVMMRFAARSLEARGLPTEATYVSLERNMKCAIGLCGHCQLGPEFVCRDGPVFRLDRVARLMTVREL